MSKLNNIFRKQKDKIKQLNSLIKELQMVFIDIKALPTTHFYKKRKKNMLNQCNVWIIALYTITIYSLIHNNKNVYILPRMWSSWRIDQITRITLKAIVCYNCGCRAIITAFFLKKFKQIPIEISPCLLTFQPQPTHF